MISSIRKALSYRKGGKITLTTVRTLVALSTLFLCSAASAANLVLNFSFEGNSTADWTATGSCVWASLAAGTNTTGGGHFLVPPAVDGADVLMSDDTSPGNTCTFYQDVAIPAATTASLTAAVGAVFRNAFNTGSVSFDVTTTGGVELINIYSRTNVEGNDPLALRPSVDLTPYVGTTVRLILTRINTGSPVGAELDDVILSDPASGSGPVATPTLSEWGMLLLAAALAASALLSPRLRAALGRTNGGSI